MAGHVVLIGLSGSGKSCVGQLLAERLRRDFIDTDEEIVRRAGCPIDEIFRDQGEGAFRALEREQVARALTRTEPAVIALGGGAVVEPENRKLAADGNHVIRLDAPEAILVARLTHSPGAERRPLLQGDPVERLRSMRAARAEAYSIATIAIDTAGMTPVEVVSALTQRLAESLSSSEVPST